MRRSSERHQTDGVRRSLRWVLRGTLTVSGAAILGAFGSMASADDGLVGGLIENVDEVVENTTSVVDPISGESASVTESDESAQQSTSIVTDVVAGVTDGLSEGEEPVAETTEVAAEVVEPVAETTEVAAEVVEPVAETTEVAAEVVEPVAETTEVAAEADEPVVRDEAATPSEAAAEESTPERDGPLLDQITGLIDPVTEPIMDVTHPVTGALVAPTVER